MLNQPTTQTEPCPVCGLARLIGTEHVACMAPDENLIRVDELTDGTIVVKAGSDLGKTLEALFSGVVAVHRQQFDYVSDDGKTHVTVDVSALQRDMAQGKVPFIKGCVDIDHAHAEGPIKASGLDYAHMLDMTTSRLSEPVLFIRWSDTTSLLADGNHRYYMLHRLGLDDILAYVVEFADWQPYAEIRRKA